MRYTAGLHGHLSAAPTKLSFHYGMTKKACRFQSPADLHLFVLCLADYDELG
jgi:hypothetical protein